MEIFYTPKFAREYKKLPKKVKGIAERHEQLFRTNPFDARLDTHKLHGRLQEFWSFSAGFRHRIVFEFGEKEVVYFHSVGDHEVYQ